MLYSKIIAGSKKKGYLQVIASKKLLVFKKDVLPLQSILKITFKGSNAYYTTISS